MKAFLLLQFLLLIIVITDIILAVMESWQSGNAPDSKSGEPVVPARRFKSCTLLLNESYIITKSRKTLILRDFVF